jgi:hypothetical protein
VQDRQCLQKGAGALPPPSLPCLPSLSFPSVNPSVNKPHVGESCFRAGENLGTPKFVTHRGQEQGWAQRLGK